MSTSLQGLNIHKPHWEFGGTFNSAWAGTIKSMEALCRLAATGSEVAYEAAQRQTLILSSLSNAHVITLDERQYQALPQDWDLLTDFRPDPHLPFASIYISIGDPVLAGFLLGATSSKRVVIVPYWTGKVFNDAWPIGFVDMTTGQHYDFLKALLGREFADDDIMAQLPTYERCYSVVRFLESANVDFEDTPVSRQVMRQAQRKNVPIAQRVYVRSPRYRRTKSGTEHEHIQFSHRFEVAGHYKHYRPDTRIFEATKRDRPHKVIEHPIFGQVVRVWCPNFVKGPDDLPLVPKTRVVKKHD